MFKYRLETLLKYRKTLEDGRRRSFSEANRIYMEELGEISKLEQERRGAMETLAESLPIIEDAAQLIIYDNYIRGSNVNLRETFDKAEHAGQIAEMERQKLVEARKKRKIIEVHKERLKERYDSEEARKERLFADEVAILKFGRKESA